MIPVNFSKLRMRAVEFEEFLNQNQHLKHCVSRQALDISGKMLLGQYRRNNVLSKERG